MKPMDDVRESWLLDGGSGTAMPQQPLVVALGDGPGILRWIAENLSAMVTILLSVALVVFLGAVLYAIIRELRRNKPVLDPIAVPPQLAAQGYTPEVVAKRLLDEMLAIQRVPTLKDLRGLDDSTALVDLATPGRRSLQSLLCRVRRLLLVPEARIGGEITSSGAGYELLLRKHDRRKRTLIGAQRSHDIATLLHAGAEDLLRCVDPWVLAHHYFAQEANESPPTFTQTAAALQDVLQHASPAERPWALNMLGICLLRQGLPAQAASRFGEAAAEGPDLPFVYQNWAEALIQIGRFDEAQLHRVRALETPARSSNLLANKAILASWLHRQDEAVQFARAAVAKSPDNGRAWAAWAYALCGLHRLDQAADACERAAALGIKDIYCSVPQAMVYAAMGKGDKALACAREAIENDRENREAIKAMGFAQLAAGDPAAALKSFDWVLARAPIAGDAAFGKGDALFALGNPEKAADQYAKAVAIDPLFPQAYVGWGRALLVLGESDEAQRKFAEAVRIDPNYPRAYREWANALKALGRTAEAQEVARRAAEIEHRNREPLPLRRRA